MQNEFYMFFGEVRLVLMLLFGLGPDHQYNRIC